MEAYNNLFTNNHKAEFEAAVNRIAFEDIEQDVAEREKALSVLVVSKEEKQRINEEIIADQVAARTKKIDTLIEDYVAQTGKVPNGRQLERLASAILYEELNGDNRPDKMTLRDTPIMTNAQVIRRHNNEASEDALASVGSDRRNYRKPVPRMKTRGEMLAIDAAARRPKDAKAGEVEIVKGAK
jgi:hypothetical protein